MEYYTKVKLRENKWEQTPYLTTVVKATLFPEAKVAIPTSTFETNADIEKNLKELGPQQIEQLEKLTTENETQAKELHKMLGNIDTHNILRFKKI